jgi:hypothetical protein
MRSTEESPGRVAATYEPRDTQCCKTAPQPRVAASAMSTRKAIDQPLRLNSRLTGARQTPTDAVVVSTSGGAAVFPRGEWEQDATWWLRSRASLVQR